MFDDPTSVLRAVLNRARKSSQRRNQNFDLNINDLRSLWDAQNGICDISGLPFSEEKYEGTRIKQPFAPSLDCIDPSKGYVPGNVRFVNEAVNFARTEWGDNVLRRLAFGVVKTEQRVHKPWYREQERKLRSAQRAALFMDSAELPRQKRVIAAYKAVISKGPPQLGGAALEPHREIDRDANR
jgi:hypothetical protein